MNDLCQFITHQIENNLRAPNGKNDLKQIAMQKYQTLNDDLNKFERLKYEQFLASGTKTVNNALKSNILKLEFANDSSGKWNVSNELR